ncbi:Rrf1p Ecym_3184 [Eremothecium cymbalariae DBVPG|uniref:Ribosome-recycling factor, mitochondrial n=1 Tax=Eremothecium cymbalariae (strain CBS 270.75 / DBVPG 7215 / KCTC 17166 / NRRL Y-17582) TaxID=931890 RepID=G8JRB4_ERECY|nr:Hypothetical protein Ecym_3184 [Eremothecium cymbalariae DBVPG\
MLKSFTLVGKSVRSLSGAKILLARRSGNGTSAKSGAEAEPIEAVDVQSYLKEAEQKFKASLEVCKKKLGDKKLGVANGNIFNHLTVGTEKMKFTDLAATSLKGRNSLTVTVFDPKYTKKVISAILASGLNLNPERIANNEQQLKIPLPPVTTEVRQQLCKDLKKVFEEYKGSSNVHSLSHIRGEVLRDLKALQKKNDSVKKVIQDVEKLHKTYVLKLQEQLKQAEKKIMN